MTANGDRSRRGRRGLTDEDRTLWRGVTRSVAPLKVRSPDRAGDTAEESAAATPAKTSPVPAALRSRAPAAAKKSPPPLVPLDRRSKQRLARGVDAIDARLDLHGKTQSQAHAALIRFLRRAQADGARVALIITGKGGRGQDEDASGRGVLKRQVPLWLSLPEFRPYVIGVDDAHVGHGGQGALYVRVRRGR